MWDKLTFQNSKLGNLLLLLLWTLIGCLLRFTQLTAKPPWTDEFATMVFSLGNDFDSVPLNQIISIEELLQPLQPNPDATIADVVSLLLHKDNHPPLYFVLAHWWMKLFPTTGKYIDLWVARSLPALFGVISIPATYWLGKIAFDSRLVGQISAALMAVSPYGIFLAQEARHYTLAILFVILSFGCLITTIKILQDNNILPIYLVIFWIFINGLGLATHYFFVITLIAEIIVLIFILIYTQSQFFFNNWRQLGIVTTGTIAIGLGLIKIIPADYGNRMTDWIQNSQITFLDFLAPIFQLMAALVTMIILLPVESSSLWFVIISGLIMLLFLLWLIPQLKKGFKRLCKNSKVSLITKTCFGFLVTTLSQFFFLTYFLKIDITRGARYNFVYFPVFIILLGAILATFYQPIKPLNSFSNLLKKKENRLFILVSLMGLLSAVTVCFNLGYQKYYRPDLLIPIVQKQSSNPILFATPQKSLVQIGEAMGLAWELSFSPIQPEPLFFLSHQNPKKSRTLKVIYIKSFFQLERPFDLWAINFQKKITTQNCKIDSRKPILVNGYNYEIYHCS